MHGFSDHCNAYYDLFPTLATRAIAVYTFDQRGWGRSASTKGQRGDSGPTSTVLADIRSFLNHIATPMSSSSTQEQHSDSISLFLMGHSMGGAEVLLLSLLQSHPQSFPRISGILLESPYIALHPSAQPNPVTVIAGKIASKVLPKRQLVQKLDSRHLCRNEQVCRDWEADESSHDTGTLEGLTGMLQRAADLTAFANGKAVQGLASKTILSIEQTESDAVPIWIGHGTEDRVTSSESSATLFKQLEVEDKTLKLYEGAYHKLHAEPHGVAEEFANDIATWILERTNAKRQGGGDVDDMKSKL